MSQLTYRLATLSDFEDLYRIKCDKENIAVDLPKLLKRTLSINGICDS